jgi:antitoxin component of RelBE/YafQ-DinJ toxin-antitoxin module
MFGLSQKEHAAEALRRGAKAAMTGAYFHQTEVAQFGLNDDASAYLYTEALIHQIQALGYISNKALSGKSWADWDFFIGSVVAGISEGDKEFGLTVSTLVPIIFKRIMEFESMPTNSKQETYADSARRVKERDHRADEAALCAALEEATRKYFADVVRLFA